MADSQSHVHSDDVMSLSMLSINDSSAIVDQGDPSKVYMPVIAPPTPAPSPRPGPSTLYSNNSDVAHHSRLEFEGLKALGNNARQRYLAAILAECTISEILFVSKTIEPRLKRDFLKDLPIEISLHILSYINDAKTLARASGVSRFWNRLLREEDIWKRMCKLSSFDDRFYPSQVQSVESANSSESDKLRSMDELEIQDRMEQERTELPPFSYRRHFIKSNLTLDNWRCAGRLLNKHRPPSATPDGGVVTSVALDHEWIIVGLASCRIQVFSARSGVLTRTLVGHESGVWAVTLVSAGGQWIDPPLEATQTSSKAGTEEPVSLGVGASTDVGSSVWLSEAMSKFGGANGSGTVDLDEMEFHIPESLRVAIGLNKPKSARRTALSDEKPKPSDIAGASEGWGNASALVVSGGCDKQLRVWDVNSGYCIYVLDGHTSTVRCLRVLHNRPIAVSGSRDSTLRVWDIQRGKLLRTLVGHEESVRALDVCGNQAVSGSYDATCRLWNVDTGECLHVLRGHQHQIYSVAFNGKYIASGGMDANVRLWDPVEGQCLQTLQGHAALVCQLQLTDSTLATGGSDGRVIIFQLPPTASSFIPSEITYDNRCRRIAAHDSSVTALQLDSHFLITGGNDGLVRLYDSVTGDYIRDLSTPAEQVWKVAHRYDKCVIMCKRAGKTVMEIWSFRPEEEDD